MIKKIVWLIVGVVAIGAAVVLIGDIVDYRLNRVYDSKVPIASEDAQRMHKSLFIVDLHADTLLWDRDFLKPSHRGHVDLQRLKDGNVAVQVFAVVTKTVFANPAPAGAQLTVTNAPECLRGDTFNQTGLLQVTQPRWPISVWLERTFDLKKRALNQATDLHNFEMDSNGKLRLIKNAADLRGLIEARIEARSRGEQGPVGALLALEGAHWLGEGDDTPDDVRNGVEELYKAGFRMLAPTHRFDNALGASSEGCNQLEGFTDNGRAFLQAVNNSNIILDLAHVTDTGIAEAAQASAVPIIVSHTGLREHCRSPKSPKKEDETLCDVARNMRDEEVRAVARTGGIIGVGIWIEAAGKSMDDVVGAFVAAHAALSDPAFAEDMRARNPEYDPFDHIALGSDFDGAVETPIDVADLDKLTQALIDRHHPNGERVFDDDAIRKIFGVNACRIFATRLPGGNPATAKDICAPLMNGIASPVAARPAQ